MRYMVIFRANNQTEAGIPPTKELMAAMMQFNEQMAKAGILLSAEGLHPSSKGVRIRFADGKHTVIKGPHSNPNELISGYWMINVKSLEEAIDWMSRCPGGDGKIDHMGGRFELELRQVYELEDFPPEIREAAAGEPALREAISRRKHRER